MKIKNSIGLGAWVGWLLGGFFCSQAALVQAQTTDGAELRRQQERERALREQFERTPDVRLQEPSIQVAPPAEETPETPCFVINEVEFSGEVLPAFTAMGAGIPLLRAPTTKSENYFQETLAKLLITVIIRITQFQLR